MGDLLGIWVCFGRDTTLSCMAFMLCLIYLSIELLICVGFGFALVRTQLYLAWLSCCVSFILVLKS
jgi:hypothetical protein